MCKISYKKSVGPNWSNFGLGFKEHHRSLYINLRRRTIRLSWVWAYDPFGRRVTTPFRTRMNYSAYLLHLGYLRLHISESQ